MKVNTRVKAPTKQNEQINEAYSSTFLHKTVHMWCLCLVQHVMKLKLVELLVDWN